MGWDSSKLVFHQTSMDQAVLCITHLTYSLHTEQHLSCTQSQFLWYHQPCLHDTHTYVRILSSEPASLDSHKVALLACSCRILCYDVPAES